jgi:membrane protease YdiL (CAAX protease family)
VSLVLSPCVKTRTTARWGLAGFLVLTFGLSWIPASLLVEVLAGDPAPGALRLLVASLVYAICMGWQPVLAVYVVRRWIDREQLEDGNATSRAGYYFLASLAPLAVAGIAMAIAHLTGGNRTLVPADAGAALPPSTEGALLLLAAMCGTLTLLCIQALAEEIGWRGYFLARLMQEFGPIRGLAAHGVIWGLWYAPLFLIASPRVPALERSLAFVVTCMLLGGLLGWLRLASRSILPTTLANGMLTISAGLPLVLRGEDPGARAAVYGPAGWVPMGLLLLFILSTRYRSVLRVPVHVVVEPRPRMFRAAGDPTRTLH